MITKVREIDELFELIYREPSHPICREILKLLNQRIVNDGDFKKDFDLAEEILNKEFGDRFIDPARCKPKGRPILSKERSLGSVVKLLTPSASVYTEAYNNWLKAIPQHVIDLVLIIKRFYKESWGKDWRQRFSVDVIILFSTVQGSRVR